MWTRAELKERAKFAFKRNYWRCVLVALVLSIITGAGSSVSSNQTTNLISDETYEEEYSDDYNYDEYDDEYADDAISEFEDGMEDDVLGAVGSAVSSIGIILGTVVVLVVIVIAAVLSVFVFAPLEVGGCHFFTENTVTQASAKSLFYSYQKGRYLKIVGTLFLKNLYTTLWTLLFIIPGIIKSYEYRMIPYLLADDPNMPREDAFRISKEMMDGNKMDAFVLDLSFIGWEILAAITCGIAGVFYVTPYVQATNAELFVTLRSNYFQKQQFQNEPFENQQFQNQEF